MENKNILKRLSVFDRDLYCYSYNFIIHILLKIKVPKRVLKPYQNSVNEASPKKWNFYLLPKNSRLLAVNKNSIFLARLRLRYFDINLIDSTPGSDKIRSYTPISAQTALRLKQVVVMNGYIWHYFWDKIHSKKYCRSILFGCFSILSFLKNPNRSERFSHFRSCAPNALLLLGVSLQKGRSKEHDATMQCS